MSQNNEGDITFEPISMGQALSVVSDLIIAFINSQPLMETEEDTVKRNQTWISLILFNLCMASKHKDRLAGVLEALIVELRNAQPSKPSEQ